MEKSEPSALVARQGCLPGLDTEGCSVRGEFGPPDELNLAAHDNTDGAVACAQHRQRFYDPAKIFPRPMPETVLASRLKVGDLPRVIATHLRGRLLGGLIFRNRSGGHYLQRELESQRRGAACPE